MKTMMFAVLVLVLGVNDARANNFARGLNRLVSGHRQYRPQAVLYCQVPGCYFMYRPHVHSYPKHYRRRR